MSAPEFADWLAICNVMARYCRCLDTKDWAGYADCFAKDVVIDTRPAGGPLYEGRDAAVAAIRSSIEVAFTTHHIHAPEITIDGDTAHAIWAMQDRNIWPNGRQLLGFGHYHQDYVRIDGEWKIARSTLTRINTEMTVPKEA